MTETEDDDLVADLFDWAAQTYGSNNTEIDLTQYEVTLGSIDKQPTGEETLTHLEVRRINPKSERHHSR